MIVIIAINDFLERKLLNRMRALVEKFIGDFSEEEKELVRCWIKENRPKLPRIERINGTDYNFYFVPDNDGTILSYMVIKKVTLVEEILEGKLSEEDMFEYVTSNDISVAIAVAKSQYATEPILDIAAHDRDREVRMAALENPNVSLNTLNYLCMDKDIEIAQLAREKLEEKI